MCKPVDKLTFWKQRIEQALQTGDIRQSVFVTSEHTWEEINAFHRIRLGNLIRPNDIVLDAGCGYGRSSEVCPGTYIGVDSSPDFIQLAKQMYPEYLFECYDLTNLPDKWNDQFDWSFCISIRAMITNNLGLGVWDLMLANLKRVTKKGIIILEYNPNDIEVLRR